MMYSGELRNELILPFLKEEYMDYTRKLELHYSIESVISLSYSGMKSVYIDLKFLCSFLTHWIYIDT